MIIYEPRKDNERYQYFLPLGAEDADILISFNGQPKPRPWVPPKVEIEEPKLKRGDTFEFASEPLILSGRAVDVLRPHLERAGELLSLPHAGETFWILNVTKFVDCLDHEKTDIDKLGMFDEPKFHGERIGDATIFKIPENSAMLFVTDAFKSDVESGGLKGFLFEKIWSDED